jgi:LPS O-antigen subunit length determinant protein (WzzB/FepE family)
LSKENEIKDLRTAINDLEIALLEPQTKEAFLTTPIYAPLKKVSPKTPIVLAVSLFGGLFLGLMFVMGRRGYRAYKESFQQ